jgi:hypothetical protein
VNLPPEQAHLVAASLLVQAYTADYIASGEPPCSMFTLQVLQTLCWVNTAYGMRNKFNCWTENEPAAVSSESAVSDLDGAKEALLWADAIDLDQIVADATTTEGIASIESLFRDVEETEGPVGTPYWIERWPILLQALADVAKAWGRNYADNPRGTAPL